VVAVSLKKKRRHDNRRAAERDGIPIQRSVLADLRARASRGAEPT